MYHVEYSDKELAGMDKERLIKIVKDNMKSFKETFFSLCIDDLKTVIKDEKIKIKITPKLVDYMGSHMDTDWEQIKLLLEDYEG